MNTTYTNYQTNLLLPTEAYTSQAWFNREQRNLFSRVWQFAGFETDISNPGDHLCVQAGLYPLIVVRGEDGGLRAFHNICRHRGTELLRTTGKAKKMIICPYHHWVYGLNGELRSVPSHHEFPNLDKSAMRLHSASVTVWKSMVFVHPDDKAEPLSVWLNGLPDKMGPHQPEKLVEYPDTQMQWEVNANWKIFVENYIDGYHLAHLHANTLNMYDHKRQTASFKGPHWTFFEPLTTAYRQSLPQKSPLPVIDHIPTEKLGAYVHLLFPNLGIAESESDWSVLQIIPVAPNRTILKSRTRTMPISTATYLKGWFSWRGDWGAGQAASDDPLASGDFMTEDIYACEQQQSAMMSPKFKVGATAQTLEQSIIEFQQRVLDFVPSLSFQPLE